MNELQADARSLVVQQQAMDPAGESAKRLHHGTLAPHQNSIVRALLVVGFALLVAVLRTLDLGTAVPHLHDEFSYLLGADTFRSRQLANPPHPIAASFETFQTLDRPTYATKYPPGQSLVLAAGWTVGGSPIVGVWLGFAFMAVSLYWMLIPWLGLEWALAGTFAVVSWLGLTYWTTTYWGGALAAAGGALVYGAAARLLQEPRAITSFFLGLGLAILANTRPFEGLLACIPPLAMVGYKTFTSNRSGAHFPARRIVIPLAVVGISTLATMAVYNRAVTGRWLEFPYMVYERTREAAPAFLWEEPKVVRTTEPRQLAFKSWALAYYAYERDPRHAVLAATYKLQYGLAFLMPFALLFPLILVPQLWRQTLTAMSCLGFALVYAGLATATWFEPHYIAPVVAPFAAVYFQCLRRLSSISSRFPRIGRQLIIVIVAAWIIPPWVHIVGTLPGLRWHKPPSDWATARAHLADSLSHDGQPHVLLVRYPAGYSVHDEWVFNGAHIDEQCVVWAHDLDDDRNRALMKYFAGRVFTSVEVVADSPYYRLTQIDSLPPDHGPERRAGAPRKCQPNSF